jgi:hypothetical protein
MTSVAAGEGEVALVEEDFEIGALSINSKATCK